MVLVLFGVMHVGSALAYAEGARERRAFLSRLRHPHVGYRLGKDGAAVWRFSVAPLRGEMDSPTGPAVALASLLGLPFVRLRCCLPDNFVGWDMGHAMGRRYVMSKAGMAASLDLHAELVPRLFRLSQASVSADLNHADFEKAADADEAAPASQQQVAMEELVGTALVLAFMQAAALLPVTELGAQRSAAAAHFAGVTTPAGWTFSALTTSFLTLVSPGNVDGTHRWLLRARLCAHPTLAALQQAARF